ncbi:MAG: hypothetical protein K2K82_05705, partial [Muribaculaceae bacterium]|nr:hypothetical protein [Muribaculaceae bacterium]
FHLTHGFWSMWQSCGWNNQIWLPRLKKIACWWTSIVIGLFTIQAVVFTVRANQNYYLTNEDLRVQYLEEVLSPLSKLGAPESQIHMMASLPVDQLKMQFNVQELEQAAAFYGNDPEFIERLEIFKRIAAFVDFLGKSEPENTPEPGTPSLPSEQNN